ncbi:hypothetical protein BD310DRAFT_920418 [Dichomitus squalens]|uniref:Uncharacterized protein n=1 Tax=Dichomitus squalens TaxID=114155 RepID=A0A4V2K8W9_9APHY|nr:hypothetical protein BD310DRAFT_920418 [Dichomitus squalens]
MSRLCQTITFSASSVAWGKVEKTNGVRKGSLAPRGSQLKQRVGRRSGAWATTMPDRRPRRRIPERAHPFCI